MLESRRAARRRETIRVALRRRRLHRRDSRAWPGPGPRPEDLRDTSTFFFAKKYRTHHCGKRRHGQPRIGYGICHREMRDAACARAASRRLEHALEAGHLDLDEVLPVKGFHGLVQTPSLRSPPVPPGPIPARTYRSTSPMTCAS